MPRFGEYVICKNTIVRARDDGVPMNDLWLSRGRVVFTVMEARGTRIFHYDDHHKRLVYSAGRAQIPVWASCDTLKFMLTGLLKKCGFRESLVAVYFSAGPTENNWHKSDLTYIPVYAVVYELNRLTEPIKLKTVEFCRSMADIKHTDYFFANVECEQAEAEGYGDILYLDPVTKEVLETSRKNILLVAGGGHIYTPPFYGMKILKGITLEIVLDLAQKNGIVNSVNRSTLTLKDFLNTGIEGAIVTSTGGVVPVESINGIGLPIKNRIWDICRTFNEYREEYFAKLEK